MIATRNAADMENSVFQKARSREDYMSCVSKLILHCNSEFSLEVRRHIVMKLKVHLFVDSKNKKPDAMPDPINALQNLASQGTRQMPSQMMPMVGGAMAANNTPPNANALQNLIHVKAILLTYFLHKGLQHFFSFKNY